MSYNIPNIGKYRKILILICWPEGKKWLFYDNLCQILKPQLIQCDLVGANFPHGFKSSFYKVLFWWPRYIWVGIRAFWMKKDYDLVIAWQQVEGFVFGFLKRVFKRTSPKLVILKFTFAARKNRLYHYLRYRLIKYILAVTDCLCCLSKREQTVRSKMFSFPIEKTRFLPLSITNLSEIQKKGVPTSNGNYIISVGKSNRDFKTLVHAMEGIKFELRIVTQTSCLRGIHLPPNVKPFLDIFGDRVADLINQSAFVVIPIDDPGFPGGESAIIEAMSFGKAIIATETNTTVEYIQDGVNGFLVTPNNEKKLRMAIKFLLSHPEEAKRMGENNLVKFEENYSVSASAKSLANLILELV